MSVEVRDPRMRDVVAEDAGLSVLGTGFLFTEGPLWHPGDEFLLFSDMPGNIIRRWDETGGVRAFRQPSEMANGLTYDRQGCLLACQHATSSVTRTEADGSVVTLATHYGDSELNSPNDIVVASTGDIYFTDPTYGRLDFYGVARDPQLDFRGVYRIGTGGALTLLADDFAQPNGLCFSLDEARLYVNDTERQHVRAFDVKVDGTLSDAGVFCETTGEGPGAPDGMKIDSAGHLFTCGPGGVHVFAADGTCLGVIRVPEVSANFTWGGRDLDTLFITASTSLYTIPTRVPGLPVF